MYIDSNNKKYVCPHCGEVKDTELKLKNHIYNAHLVFNKSVAEAMNIYGKKKKWILYNLDKEVLKEWFTRHKAYNNFVKLYDKQFGHFYELVTHIKKWENTDFDIFFGPFLDWKIANPKVSNSLEMCKIVFPNHPKIAQRLYDEKMKARNPFTGHGKELSPFSKDFIGYKDKTEEEKKKAVLEATKHDKIGRNPNQKEYWMKRGYSRKEAIEIISERQTTFSKEICIEKFGEEEGTKRWIERQQKWMGNYKKSNFSKISQEMFWKIYDKIKDKNYDVYFATLHSITKEKDESGYNHEYIIETMDGCVKPDFLLKDKKRIIEFDGDYWHCEARGNQERDRIRDKQLKEAGYEVYRVPERDYRREPIAMVYEAVQFLLED